MFGASDQRQVILLALFDVSVAFDTVNLTFYFTIAIGDLFWNLGTLTHLDPLLPLRSLTGWWYVRAYAVFCSLRLFGTTQRSVFALLFYILYTADLNRILLEIGLHLINMLMTPKPMFVEHLLHRLPYS